MMTILGLLFQSDTIEIKTPPIQQIAPRSIEQIINEAAIENGIDAEKFLNVAKCESSLRPDVVGDEGNSIGLWQIHLPSHPDVTEEFARNPVLATAWSAEKFKKDPTIWSCYRILYGRPIAEIHQ